MSTILKNLYTEILQEHLRKTLVFASGLRLNPLESEMYYAFEINGSRIYECFYTMPDSPTLVFYYFSVTADGETHFYANNPMRLGGIGCMTHTEPENLYQITVYKKGFSTPDWMKNAVVYQIFPDRFYSEDANISHGTKRSWNDEPFYRSDQFGGHYLSNDFFGGNLKGIERKLSYLKDLGITAIYLNPIFEAFSNHRYDTSDYENVDPNLGSNEDFISLSDHAKKLGIKIILDGVFSHTGSDSRYFNKFGNFETVGAFQSKDSPFYSWYTFIKFPDIYDSWWGFDTLPNVNELDNGYMEYIVKGKNSISKKWLRMGASGWRLDVADELPDKFIEEFRKSIKEENPDSLLIGEVWEDASNKVSYGSSRRFLFGSELDSVMNYVFREAVLDYLLSADASLFARRISSLIENYPLQSLYSAMNLISSHDVPRAMTVLSGAPDFKSMDRESQHSYVISTEAYNIAMKRMYLAAVLQMTLPGAPCIYYGDETGMTGYADPFNRHTFNWNNTNCSLSEHIKKFIALRNAHACLRTGRYEMLYYLNGIMCFMRSIENKRDVFGADCKYDESIVVILNAGKECENGFSLNLERFGAVSASDIFTSEKYQCKGGFFLDILPYSYKILKLEREKNECIKIQPTL